MTKAETLSRLRRRRRHLYASAALTQALLDKRRANLLALDRAILALKPDYDPSKLKPPKPRKRFGAKTSGRVSRQIIRAFVNAKGPLGIRDLLGLITLPSNAKTKAEVRIRAHLTYLEKTGRIVKRGSGVNARWDLTAASNHQRLAA